jgi:hypothetical protein
MTMQNETGFFSGNAGFFSEKFSAGVQAELE